MQRAILFGIFLLGNLIHILFFDLNDILKIADSFSYLQMSYSFSHIMSGGFGNGWFGFLYSVPIALVEIIMKNEMLSAMIVNTLAFNLLIVLCFHLGKKYLSFSPLMLFIGLLFLSPILLHYQINVLSENIYIPLFVWIILYFINYERKITYGGSIVLGILFAFFYFIRGEAFIYLASAFFIFLYLYDSKKYFFWETMGYFATVVATFFIIIFPYLVYLHTITGDWGLTNKGTSNLRQAQLRGISKMDDEGFEQAVAELRPDKHGLIAGFAGGMQYEAPKKGEGIVNYLLSDPLSTVWRSLQNQQKLITQNLPRIVNGNAYDLFSNEGSFFYHNPLYLLLMLIPFGFIGYGIWILRKENEYFLIFCFGSFFLIATFFFSIFFILDRYFVIFIPFFLLFLVKGIWEISQDISEKKFFLPFGALSGFIICIYLLGAYSYYQTNIAEDDKYEVKKIAGERIASQQSSEKLRWGVKIMERFPVVTFYAGSKQRWITPYTDSIADLVEYARFKKIQYLVVDSIDFKQYRPQLIQLLQEPKGKYEGLKKIKEFKNKGQTVILYEVEQKKEQ